MSLAPVALQGFNSLLCFPFQDQDRSSQVPDATSRKIIWKEASERKL